MRKSNPKGIGINVDVDTTKGGLISLVITLTEILRDTLKLQAERMIKKEEILNQEEKERLKTAFTNLENVIEELKEEQDIVESVSETRERLNKAFAFKDNGDKDDKSYDSLVNALDTILSKGTVIYGDIPLSVADIILANINLKAALAGGVTMAENKLITKEELHPQKKVESKVPLGKNEKITSSIFGSYWAKQLQHPRWQLGKFYFTNRRFLLFKPELTKISFETTYEAIKGWSIKLHPLRGRMEARGKGREELILFFKNKEMVRLHSKNIKGLKEMIAERMKERNLPFEELPYHFPEEERAKFLNDGEEIIEKEQMWSLTSSSRTAQHVGAGTWKNGSLYLTDKRVLWQDNITKEIIFEFLRSEISKVVIEVRDFSFKGAFKDQRAICKKALIISSNGRESYFSGDEEKLEKWQKILEKNEG